MVSPVQAVELARAVLLLDAPLLGAAGEELTFLSLLPGAEVGTKGYALL